jgi:endonuclease/exonuclease/phosphatase family metal-dependent hydrolase
MTGENGQTRQQTALVVVATALATLFVLQAMRLSVPSVIVVLDQANRNEIVRTILLGFVLILGGGLWRRLLGVWRGAGVALALLTGARVAMQLASDRPEALIWLGAAVVACWGWGTLALLAGSRSAAGFGLVLALVADLALRIALRSVDLGWMSDGPRLAGMLVLAALALALAAGLARATAAVESDGLSGAPLLAIGPALGLYLAFGGSFGANAAGGRTGFLEVAALLAVMAVGAVVLVALYPRERLRRPGVHALAAALGAFLAVTPGQSIMGSALLIAVACSGERPARWRLERGATVWLTLGMVLQILLLAQYYTYTASSVFLYPLAVIGLLGALAAGGVRGQRPAWTRLVAPALAASALVLALACGWAWLGLRDGEPATQELAGPITVMTWNLQTGFSEDNIFNLEAQAQVIEAANPDILLLQEVTRGWAVSGSVDEVTWLGQRLGMHVYFGPVSGDDSWGNAILTNAPVLSYDTVRFSSTVNLDRGAVKVVVQAGDQPLTVISTHLDDGPAGAGARQTQVAELLAFWGGEGRAIIGGDFNTNPGTPPIVQMTDAGLVDTGAALPADAETYVDEGVIDYLFVTADLPAGDATIGTSTASDHRSLTTVIAAP